MDELSSIFKLKYIQQDLCKIHVKKKKPYTLLEQKEKKNLTKSNDIDAYHGNNTIERTQATPTLIRVPFYCQNDNRSVQSVWVGSQNSSMGPGQFRKSCAVGYQVYYKFMVIKTVRCRLSSRATKNRPNSIRVWKSAVGDGAHIRWLFSSQDWHWGSQLSFVQDPWKQTPSELRAYL